MPTEVKIWEIKDKELNPIGKTLKEAGKYEFKDLEQWIKSYPALIGEDILLIGEQIDTISGPLDYLGIDQNGNIVIIELKRDKVPRRALAQAIDYASDVARWSISELDDKCRKYTKQNLKNYIINNFPIEDIDWDEISINQTQRILLVGTSIGEKLERMMNWLSESYGVIINALIISYGITSKKDEVLATSYIVSEDIEKEHAKIKNKRFETKTIQEHREWIKDPKLRSCFKDVENRIIDLNRNITEEAKLRYIVFSYKKAKNCSLISKRKLFLSKWILSKRK